MLSEYKQDGGNSFYLGNLLNRLIDMGDKGAEVRNQRARDLSEAWHIVRTAQKLTCSALADAQLSRVLRYIGGQMPIPR